uniref:Uncharacterized protein n=1 Tax=viral metagenome TaxID=1070528 RepID=A0A6C0KRV2_9ZZZZ
MGAGSHGKTSTIFYRRGVPNQFIDFGLISSGNYAVFQPARPGFFTPFFRRSISNFISISR